MSNLEETILEMKKQLDMLVAAIVGDPTDTSNPGVIIRLDRLERSYKTMKYVLTLVSSGMLTIISAIITAIVLRLI